MSPVLVRPPRAPRSRPVKPGARAPGVEESTTVMGKRTGAARATAPDEARRTNAGPRGTPERHAAGYNHGTGPGAKEQRPPGAANPDSAPHTRNHGRGGGAKQHRTRRGAPTKTNPRRPWSPRTPERRREAETRTRLRRSREEETDQDRGGGKAPNPSS